MTLDEPKSAEQLGAECEASLPTIYRRLNELEEYELVEAVKRPNPGGNSYKVYRSRYRELTVSFGDDHISIDTPVRPNAAGRITDIWSDLRE